LIKEGELLHGGRYEVSQSIGKGSFGRVVRARDVLTGQMVAVKIVKSKPAFLKQAQVELRLLASLNRGIGLPNDTTAADGTAAAAAASAAATGASDAAAGANSSNTASAARQVSATAGTAVTAASASSGSSLVSPSASSSSPFSDAASNECDRFNIVRTLDAFLHRGHQCIVFELLSINLYELLRNTHFSGVSLKLMGKFTTQLLMTLAYLSCAERGEERIIHCDLKPENILLRSPKKSAIKVIGQQLHHLHAHDQLHRSASSGSLLCSHSFRHLILFPVPLVARQTSAVRASRMQKFTRTFSLVFTAHRKSFSLSITMPPSICGRLVRPKSSPQQPACSMRRHELTLLGFFVLCVCFFLSCCQVASASSCALALPCSTVLTSMTNCCVKCNCSACLLRTCSTNPKRRTNSSRASTTLQMEEETAAATATVPATAQLRAAGSCAIRTLPLTRRLRRPPLLRPGCA
jgi:serine/threonine protein kinase